ncbi:MAG: hypothetical protein FD123_1325 [Bacteroidetes bacterium]|nr:MAG: hypothetical protein FD123_1325 [Bacteroidota bacterium]
MKKPLLRIVFVLLAATVAAQGLFMLGSKGLQRYHHYRSHKFEMIFHGKHDHDLIFIGSSRTQSAIDPMQVDSICGTDSYNLGVEGANLAEFHLLFKAWLENHPNPKMVLLTLDLSSFDLSRRFFNPVAYYPYLESEAVSAAMSADDRRPLLLRALPFLQVADYDDYTRSTCFKGLRGETDVHPAARVFQGFLNSDEKGMTGADTNIRYTTIPVDEEAKKMLEEIISTCRSRNIRLILTYAPEYREGWQKHASNSAKILEMITKLAAKHKLPFLRHDQLDICSDPALFVNTGHLNKKGAAVYSRLLGETLRPYLIAPRPAD